MLQPKDTYWQNGYKNKTHIYDVCKKPTSDLKHIQTQSQRMEKYIPCNGKQKKAGVAILISDKIYLKIEITRDKKGHYIMTNGLIEEEDKTIVCAPNIRAPQYIRQIVTERNGQ